MQALFTIVVCICIIVWFVRNFNQGYLLKALQNAVKSNETKENNIANTAYKDDAQPQVDAEPQNMSEGTTESDVINEQSDEWGEEESTVERLRRSNDYMDEQNKNLVAQSEALVDKGKRNELEIELLKTEILELKSNAKTVSSVINDLQYANELNSDLLRQIDGLVKENSSLARQVFVLKQELAEYEKLKK